jgi:hypothetical protein
MRIRLARKVVKNWRRYRTGKIIQAMNRLRLLLADTCFLSPEDRRGVTMVPRKTVE